MGKKVESSFVNMVVVLFTITLIAAAAVGYVYSLTEGTIAAANAQKQADAIKNVIPVEFAETTSEKVAVGVDTVEVFYAKNGDQIVGTAVKSFTNSGFNGYISVMVGFDTKGTITGYSVLSQGETPGLGSKMVDWFTENGKGNIIHRIFSAVVFNKVLDFYHCVNSFFKKTLRIRKSAANVVYIILQNKV